MTLSIKNLLPTKLVSMKHISLLLVVICMMSHSLSAYKRSQSKQVSGVSISNANLELIDNVIPAGEEVLSFEAQVKLRYGREDHSDMLSASEWNCIVTYDVFYYDDQNVSQTITGESLEVSFTKEGVAIYASLNPYDQVGNDVSIQVTGMDIFGDNGTPSNLSNLPGDIHLELILTTNHHQNVSGSGPNIGVGPNNDMVFWDYADGAESYELQWVFIDEYDDFPVANPSPLEYFQFKEGASIITPEQYFEFDPLYGKGELYFRVRSIGVFPEQSNNTPAYSAWSYGTQSSTAKIVLNNSFEANKNWQSAWSFAEDGKNKKVVSYYDGTLRSRQATTYVSSNDLMMVAETKYDYEGRAVLNVMPTPLAGSAGFTYKSALNTFVPEQGSLLTNGLDKAHLYDNDGGANPMNDMTGAAKYYSENNDVSTHFRDMIPDANGYTFSQVEFTRDGLGRISRSGGVGETFGLHRTELKHSDSDYEDDAHYASFFYGSAKSTELHRLFGSNVGNANHYKKQLTVDANGQVSVAYLDQSGRTIAAALAGESPKNVVALDETYTSPQNITVNFMDENDLDLDKHTSELSTTILNATPGTSYDFTYDLAGTNNIGTSSCEDCQYLLDIYIVGPDGIPVDITMDAPYDQATLPLFLPITEFACESNDDFHEPVITFTVNFNQVGDYQIIKKLSLVDGDLYNEVLTWYDPNSGAVTPNGFPDYNLILEKNMNQIDYSQCDYSCEERCRSEVIDDIREAETAAEATTILATMANEVIPIVPGYTQAESDQMELNVRLTAAYDIIEARVTNVVNQGIADDVNTCMDVLCDVQTYLDESANDECESIEQQILDQLSPEGYYFVSGSSIINDANTSSITFEDSDGSASLDDLDNPITATWIINNPDEFDDNWAIQMKDLHPEYCHVATCNDLKATRKYSTQLSQVTSWDNAVNSGYINPLALSGGPSNGSYTRDEFFFSTEAQNCLQNGDDLLQVMRNKFNNYHDEVSMGDLNNDGINDVFTLWEYVQEPAAYGSTIAPTPNQQWQRFTGAYLALKEEQVHVYNEVCQTPACGYETHDDAIVVKAIVPTTIPAINTAIDDATDDHCDGLCTQNANDWLGELQSICGVFSSLDQDAIKFHLTNYCISGCPFENPFSVIIKADFDNGNVDLMNAESIVNNYGCSISSITSDGLYEELDCTTKYVVTSDLEKFEILLNDIHCYFQNCDGSNPNDLNSIDFDAPQFSHFKQRVEEIGWRNQLTGNLDYASKLDLNDLGNYYGWQLPSGSSAFLFTMADGTFSMPDVIDIEVIDYRTVKLNLINGGHVIKDMWSRSPMSILSQEQCMRSIKQNCGCFEKFTAFVNNSIGLPSNSESFHIRPSSIQLECIVDLFNQSHEMLELDPNLIRVMYNGLQASYIGNIEPECFWPGSSTHNSFDSQFEYSGQVLGISRTSNEYVVGYVQGSNAFTAHAYNLLNYQNDTPINPSDIDFVEKILPIYKPNDVRYRQAIVHLKSGTIIEDAWFYCPYDVAIESDGCLNSGYENIDISSGSFRITKLDNTTFDVELYDEFSNLLDWTYIHEVYGVFPEEDPQLSGINAGFDFTGKMVRVAYDNGTEIEFVNAYVYSDSPSEAFFDNCSTNTPLTIADLQKECVEDLEADAQFSASVEFKNAVDEFVSTYLLEHQNKCFEGDFAEDFYVNYDLLEYHYTLYYYDQAGSLVQTIPPSGVRVLDTDPAISNPHFDASGNYLFKDAEVALNTAHEPPHIMPTVYRYDAIGNLLVSNTPDAGQSEFWYDEVGRIRLSQDARQAAKSTPTNMMLSYTRYDELGRAFEGGQLEPFDNQGTLEDGYDPTTVVNFSQLYDENFDAQQDAIWAVLNNPSFPDLDDYYATQLTRTTYVDEYLPGEQTNLRNAVSAIETFVDRDATSPETYSAYSYDIHGAASKVFQFVEGFQQTVMEYDYELLSGNTNMVKYQEGKPDQFFHRYTYDADNTLTSVYTSSDGYLWDEDARYFFYDHGPIARVEIGEDKVQGMDYMHTLNGWKKGVNAPDEMLLEATNFARVQNDPGHDGSTNVTGLNQFVGADEYAFSLTYFKDDYQAVSQNNMANGAASHDVIWAGQPGALIREQGMYNGNIVMMTQQVNRLAAEELTNKKLGNGDIDYSFGLRHQTYEHDQLGRIISSRQSGEYNRATGWASRNAGVNTEAYDSHYEYDEDGNLQHLVRNGDDGNVMDDLLYKYHHTDFGYAENTHQLRYVTDQTTASSYDHDIDNMTVDNFEYDEIGNLIADPSEEIEHIEWRVDGKMQSLTRTTGSNKPDLEFVYDPSGNRVAKIVKPKVAGVVEPAYKWTTSFYARDASGSTMGVYEAKDNNANAQVLNLKEKYIFGASRVGKVQTTIEIWDNDGAVIVTGIPVTQSTRGEKSFELSNHLDNVMAVVNDRKFGLEEDGDINGVTDYYQAQLLAANDYYPFGMAKVDRTASSDEYRYGFNGKEKVDEHNGQDGAHYDYGFRVYDPRLAKFLSVDPLTSSYPWYTPYQFAGNKPIMAVDLDGLEEFPEVQIDLAKSVVTFWGGEIHLNKKNIPSDWVDKIEHITELSRMDTWYKTKEQYAEYHKLKSTVDWEKWTGDLYKIGSVKVIDNRISYYASGIEKGDSHWSGYVPFEHGISEAMIRKVSMDYKTGNWTGVGSRRLAGITIAAELFKLYGAYKLEKQQSEAVNNYYNQLVKMNNVFVLVNQALKEETSVIPKRFLDNNGYELLNFASYILYGNTASHMFNDKQKSEFEQVYGDLITQFGADEVKAILDGLTTADWSKYYFDNGYYVEDENNRAYKLDDKGREIDVHTW